MTSISANARTIHALSKLNSKKLKEYIGETDDKFVNFICRAANSVCEGKLPIKSRKRLLDKYRTNFVVLKNSQRKPIAKRRQVLQKGGFLGALIAGLAPLAIDAITRLIHRKKK